MNITFENIKKLKNNEFYRYFGIKRFHFNQILEKLLEIELETKKFVVKKINFQ